MRLRYYIDIDEIPEFGATAEYRATEVHSMGML